MDLAETRKIAVKSSVAYIAPHLKQDKEKITLATQQLSYRLQQTLDLNAMLKLFCEKAAELVPAASVAYRNDAYRIFEYFGEQQSFKCQYSLEIENQSLGLVECTAKRNFTEKELLRLEHLLSVLVFPLRNALMYREAVQSAEKDPLTQLGNRASYNKVIETEISRSNRHNADLCLMIVDIDHFKKINDTYGHLAGDQILQQFSDLLKNTLRQEDAIFRIGGEEFVVVLGSTNLPNARLAAERLRMEIEKSVFKAMDLTIPVSASIGVTLWQNGENENTLFHRADQALYAAKSTGRNRVKMA